MDLRKIDVLVAEHVMGWQLGSAGDLECFWDSAAKKLRAVEDWTPSSDISAAWEVIEKLHVLVLGISRSADKNWHARFSRYHGMGDFEDFPSVTNRSAPLAICLAALKVKDIDVP